MLNSKAKRRVDFYILTAIILLAVMAQTVLFVKVNSRHNQREIGRLARVNK